MLQQYAEGRRDGNVNVALSSSVLGTDFPGDTTGSAFVPSLSVTHTATCVWPTLDGEQ